MDKGSSIEESGIKGIFAGGTEFTPQWYRFCREELLGPNVYITPTYGNTLMGLACGKPFDPADNFKITYYAPQPRAVIETVEFNDYNQVVPYGSTGRVKLYTMTKELFVPGFMERDEGERELPTTSTRGTASAARGHSTNSRRRRPSAFINHQSIGERGRQPPGFVCELLEEDDSKCLRYR